MYLRLICLLFMLYLLVANFSIRDTFKKYFFRWGVLKDIVVGALLLVKCMHGPSKLPMGLASSLSVKDSPLRMAIRTCKVKDAR